MLTLLKPKQKDKNVAIRLTFNETGTFEILNENKITILELSSFIYDLSLLHDCIVLSSISEYSGFEFSKSFWSQNGRPLKPEHKLYLNSINHNSPLSLEVIIPLAAVALGIPWLLVQAFEKIQNWDLNKHKLKLEIEKLKLEIQQKNIEAFIRDNRLEDLLKESHANSIFDKIIERIENRQFSATNIDVKLLADTDDKEKTTR